MDDARVKRALSERTSFLRCLAAAGVWYALAVVMTIVQWKWPIFTVQLALLPWLITAVVSYIVVREMAVKPWGLTLSMLPVFAALYSPVIYLLLRSVAS